MINQSTFFHHDLTNRAKWNKAAAQFRFFDFTNRSWSIAEIEIKSIDLNNVSLHLIHCTFTARRHFEEGYWGSLRKFRYRLMSLSTYMLIWAKIEYVNHGKE